MGGRAWAQEKAGAQRTDASLCFSVFLSLLLNDFLLLHQFHTASSQGFGLSVFHQSSVSLSTSHLILIRTVIIKALQHEPQIDVKRERKCKKMFLSAYLAEEQSVQKIVEEE